MPATARTRIKARILPRWPSTVQGGTGIDVARSGTSLTVSLVYSGLSVSASPLSTWSLAAVEADGTTFKLVTLANLLAVSHTHTAAQISDSTTVGRAVVTAADAAAARTAIDAPATSHTHTVSALSDASANARSFLQAANYAAMTALLPAVVGDSGSGGTKGLVPAPASGDAAAGKFLKADGTYAVPPGSASSEAPRGYLSGLTTSIGTDTDHDIDIAAGVCRSDDNTDELALAATLTKQIDASWAVGTNQGGLDTGSVGNTTWYYVWLIKRSDTGVVDALFSTSKTAPTMPTNYDLKRLIGMVKTNGSANIIAYKQVGDEWTWTAGPVTDSTTAATTTSQSITLPSVPPIAGVKALLNVYGYTTGAGSTLWVRDLSVTDASVVLGTNANFRDSTSGGGITAPLTVTVNGSGQVGIRSAVNMTATSLIVTGFIFRRGRDD